MKNDTPMAATKTLVKGMTTGNPAYFENLIYLTGSPRPTEMVQIAKNRKITDMKMSDFHFKKVPGHKDTIIASFMDTDGDHDQWKLVFSHVKTGWEYFSSLSSPIVNNDTPLQTAKTLLKGVAEDEPYLVGQLDGDSSCPRGCVERYIEFQFGSILGVPYDQFKFAAKRNDVLVTYSQNKKPKNISLDFNPIDQEGTYGYKFFGVTQTNPFSAVPAARTIILSMISHEPVFINRNLVNPSCQQALGMIEAAKKSKLDQLQIPQVSLSTKDSEDTVLVDFAGQNGRTKWTLHFVKKGNNYKLDHSNIPVPDPKKTSQMPNGSAKQAAESLVQGMIGQNADELVQVINENPCWNAVHFVNANQKSGVGPGNLKSAHFQKGKSGNTVTVTFKNDKGQTIKWIMLFKKETDGYKLIGSNLTPYSVTKNLLHYMKNGNGDMIKAVLGSDLPKSAVSQLLKAAKANDFKEAFITNDEFKKKGKLGFTFAFVNREGKKVEWAFHAKNQGASYVIDKFDLDPKEDDS